MKSGFGIGQEGGQRYDVADGIRTFLKQMAEHTDRVVPAVVKELIQNADDAGATHIEFLLDERSQPPMVQPGREGLFLPGLIIRNNAWFKIGDDVAPGQLDDFAALCTVAKGHKVGQVTAAGRYGLGFNSVYFLTDTPIIFSRRYVHIFDVAQTVMDVPGWKFELDEFPAASGSDAGAIKADLEWMLPKVALNENRSFAEFAKDPSADYKQTVMRLPLRSQAAGTQTVYSESFPTEADRTRALDDAVEQAARSMLFLKNVHDVRFSVLRDGQKPEEYAHVCITPNPESFRELLTAIEQLVPNQASCSFQRTVTLQTWAEPQPKEWSFHIYHRALLENTELEKMRDRLRRNEEKAVPWVSLAIPRDAVSMAFDGDRDPAWRVFLPLTEPGPSRCLFNAAFFVGPSRQKCEYRTDGSDESTRKTQWNQQLVRHGLVPLLREASADMMTLVPDLARGKPADYLALFPEVLPDKDEPTTLAKFFRQEFCKDLWFIQVPDLWDEPLDLAIAEDADALTIQLIPAWLEPYRNRFQALPADSRRFVRFALGDLLSPRVPSHAKLTIVRELPLEIVKCVLGHDEPPRGGDLARLIERLATGEDSLTADLLDGLWCFQASNSEYMLRFDPDTLYVLSRGAKDESHLDCLSGLDLKLAKVEHVDPRFGLPAAAEKRRRAISNIVPAGEEAVLELLQRVGDGVTHNSVSNHRDILPLIDFLCSLKPSRLKRSLRLPFLVKTASSTSDRRATGTIILRSRKESEGDVDVAETFLLPAFPGLDPEFLKPVDRLLAHAPDLIAALSDSKCEVAYAREEHLLGLLLRAKHRDHHLASRLEASLNGRHHGRGAHERMVQRAMTILFAQAERAWDALSTEDRLAFLALPIHRFANGSYGPIACSQEELDQLTERIHLQSRDDLRDAPIQLPDTRLLRTNDAATKSFYRIKLNLSELDRRLILSYVLREIGTRDDETNRKHLLYIEEHYNDTVKRLENSASESDHKHLGELRQLFKEALLAPCIDGEWRASTACVDGHLLSAKLKEQGWRTEELSVLLVSLFPGRAILTLDAMYSSAVRSLCDITSLPIEALAESALSSECPELAVMTRARILADNWESRPSAPKVAEIVKKLKIPCGNGLSDMDHAEIVDPELADMYPMLVAALVPIRVDLTKCSEDLDLGLAKVNQILRLLDVPLVGVKALADRLAKDFESTWPESSQDRVTILRFVMKQDLVEKLRDSVRRLPVILTTGTATWVHPDQVIIPSLLKTNPPFVEDRQQGLSVIDETDVAFLLESWGGISKLRDLVDLVCGRAAAKPTAQREAAGRELVKWLERLLDGESANADEVSGAFKDRRWVFARKGEERQFCYASEVVLHSASDVLGRSFWVPVSDLPPAITNSPTAWQFLPQPTASEESLSCLAECLACSGDQSANSSAQTYRLLVNILEDRPDLRGPWEQLSIDKPVFRCFRTPEVVVKRPELFIGSDTESRDVGEVLFCLRAAEKLPPRLEASYEKLGIAASPTPEHLLHALINLDASSRLCSGTRMQLLQRLRKFDLKYHPDYLFACRVKTCAGAYVPLGEVYWDEELGTPERCDSGSAEVLIDTSDEFSREFVDWTEKCSSEACRRLRILSRPRLAPANQTSEWTPSVSQILGPWEEWFEHLCEGEGILRDEGESLGLTIPHSTISVVPVVEIRVTHELGDGSAVSGQPEWGGPSAIANGPDTILVRVPDTSDAINDDKGLRNLDRRIAEEASFLLLPRETLTIQQVHACVDFALETLERPSVVLKRLGDSRMEHLLHQYRDQVADAEFAKVHDELQRAKKNSPKRKDLHNHLWEIMKAKYVEERRKLICGHGYDEFSIFTELIQNAEDAYAQRRSLGMPAAEHATARFAYLATEGRDVLRFEHFGRPFNYWRHGAKQVDVYREDVDGVLRSAGSFKPGTPNGDEAQTVGRFGLGFKSVYLITDEPNIHSGSWHFRIEHGCRPVEISPPGDLVDGATRFDLPLRQGSKEIDDDSGERLATLVPFLRQIQQVELRNSGGSSPTSLRISAASFRNQHEPGACVELVEILGTTHLGDAPLRLLRVRHTDHQGQLGLYLGMDGLPYKWGEAFKSDLYVTLPLKTRIGVGIGVSSDFDIQSGRTHLVSSEENENRFDQIAALVRSLPNALQDIMGSDGNLSESLLRFWSLWDWGAADDQVATLRDRIAREVASLPLQDNVVPLIKHGAATNLAASVVLYFDKIPETVVNILMEERCPWILRSGDQSSLDLVPITTKAFNNAYRAACRVGGVDPLGSLHGVDWESLGTNLAQSRGLAENPELLNKIALALDELHFDDSRKKEIAEKLLTTAPVATEDCDISVPDSTPRNVFAPDLDGRDMLPTRRMPILSSAYDECAVDLLRHVDLRITPSEEEIRTWMESGDLTHEECLNLIRFFAENDRWMDSEYRHLESSVQSQWVVIEGKKERLSAAKAVDTFLETESSCWDIKLKLWLGFDVPAPFRQESELKAPRSVNATSALEALYDWWKENGQEYTKAWERKTYPSGRIPNLKDAALESQAGRQEWLTVLLLGSLHTLGRTRPEQHRSFLDMCMRKGWMDVFTNADAGPERWMDVLDEYIEGDEEQGRYRLWMKQFVNIYQLSRWLKDYVETFRAIRMFPSSFQIDQITSPRTAAPFQGGGPDAPPVTRVLGIGACFVIREMCRCRLLDGHTAHEHCYVPSDGVLKILQRIGLDSGADGRQRSPSLSKEVYRFLAQHLGRDRAAFDQSFDLPLIAMQTHSDVWDQILEKASN